MKKFHGIILLAFALLFFGSSCKKSIEDGKPWTSEWLLPLVKADITPLAITTLDQKEFSFGIKTSDLGWIEGLIISSPAMQHTAFEPFLMESAPIIDKVHLNQCLIELTVSNNLPIAIDAGSTIAIFNEGETTPVFELLLTEELAAGKSEQFDLDLSGKSVTSNLYYKVSLNTPEFEGKIFDYGSGLNFTFFFEKVSLTSLDIATSQTHIIKDTVGFDGGMLEFDELDTNIPDSVIQGTLRLRANNDLPVGLKFQIDFLDENNQYITSIFEDDFEIPYAHYTGGNFDGESEAVIEIQLPKNRLSEIKNAQNVVYSFKFNTIDDGTIPYIEVNNEMTLFLKIIGDLKLLVNPSLFQ